MHRNQESGKVSTGDEGSSEGLPAPEGKDPKGREPDGEAAEGFSDSVGSADARLRLVLENLADHAIFTTDTEGRITSWNAGATHLLGYSEADVVGRSFELIFTEEARSQGVPRMEMEKALRSGMARDQRWHLRADGTRFWADGTLASLTSDGDSVRGFVKILQDKTAARLAQERLAARARQQEAVASFGHLALSGLQLDSLLEHAVELLGRVLDLEFVEVLRLLPGTRRLRLEAGAGWREGLVGRALVPAEPGSRADFVIGADAPVVVGDLRNEDRFPPPDLLAEHGVVSGMVVAIPTLAAGPWGLVGVHTSTPRRFSQDDANFLRAIANILAQAIHRKEWESRLQELNATLEQRVAERSAVAESRARRLREMAGELTRAEREERGRIARILHDHLQQLLAAGRMMASSILEEDPPSGIRTPAERVVRVLDRALETARDLTVELSPPVLREEGLGAALEWLRGWMEEQHGLRVRVGADPRIEVEDEDVRAFLFESIRELLFNAAKHAGVSEAVVRAEALDDGRLRVEVEDEGRGFDPEAEERRTRGGGFGLFSIRERVGLLDGSLEVESRPGEGTRVSLVVAAGRRA